MLKSCLKCSCILFSCIGLKASLSRLNAKVQRLETTQVDISLACLDHSNRLVKVFLVFFTLAFKKRTFSVSYQYEVNADCIIYGYGTMALSVFILAPCKVCFSSKSVSNQVQKLENRRLIIQPKEKGNNGQQLQTVHTH